MTMVSRMMDVPIDLDEDSSFTIDISGDLVERAISTAASLKHNKSAWSSSSGSYYDDDEATTSPIDLGGKWYWNSPVGDSSDSMSSSYTHDSGFLSRSNTTEEKSTKSTGTSAKSPRSLLHRRITNSDPSGPQEVMAKRLQSTREIELLQHLNASPLRLDPWNPSAPLISIVNADHDGGDDGDNSDEPLAVFDPLVPCDAQPLATVEEALDFFMQLLQGLVFLQENNIVHGDIHAGVVMMDPAGCPAEGARVNRVQCNVRYHLVDFTHASIVQQLDDQLFGEDLRDLGILIEKDFGTKLPELSSILAEMATAHTSPLTTASRILSDLEDLVASVPTDRIKGVLA